MAIAPKVFASELILFSLDAHRRHAQFGATEDFLALKKSQEALPASLGSPPAFRIPPLASFAGLRSRSFFAFTVFGFAGI